MALGGDFTLPFQPLHDMLNAADITIGTLDATASDAVTPFGCIADVQPRRAGRRRRRASSTRATT